MKLFLGRWCCMAKTWGAGELVDAPAFWDGALMMSERGRTKASVGARTRSNWIGAVSDRETCTELPVPQLHLDDGSVSAH